jgi:acyltransferase-like protein
LLSSIQNRDFSEIRGPTHGHVAFATKIWILRSFNLGAFRVRDEIRSLTGLRGLAALWVLTAHFFGVYGVTSFVTGRGSYGVILFFVLSGFILGYVHDRDFSQSFRLVAMLEFLGLRLAKIYPLHAAITVLWALVVSLHIWPTVARDNGVALGLNLHGGEVSFRTSLSLHFTRPPRRRCKLSLCVRAGRQAHGEHRALADRARNRHIAAHQARELTGDSEPKPGAPETLCSRGIGLGELLDSLACCSAVMPIPVSATASSIQLPPLASLRARSVTSPSNTAGARTNTTGCLPLRPIWCGAA